VPAAGGAIRRLGEEQNSNELGVNKITLDSATALKTCRQYRNGNTRVHLNEFEDQIAYDLRLHGNLIARYFPTERQLIIKDAGCQTRATKERLNGILEAFGLDARIYEEGFDWRISLNGTDLGWKGFETFKVD
jgi:hypothetical protein